MDGPIPLTWDNLKVALAVERTGSLARGAVLLGIDQSTASRKLSALEADLGIPIFVRSRAGLSPTEAGQRVLARAHEIEDQVNQLGEEISENRGQPVGLVRVLGNAWVLNRLTEQVFPQLFAQHPGIDLRLIATNPRSPVRGEATISLWFEAAPRHGDFAVLLGQVEYGTFARRDLDADTLPWVSFYDEDSPKRAPTAHWERMREQDGGALRFTSTDARDVRALVRQGLGRAILPICLLDGDLDIASVGDAPITLTRVMHLHVHPDTVQSRRVQVVMALLRAEFADVFARPDGTRITPPG